MLAKGLACSYMICSWYFLGIGQKKDEAIKFIFSCLKLKAWRRLNSSIARPCQWNSSNNFHKRTAFLLAHTLEYCARNSCTATLFFLWKSYSSESLAMFHRWHLWHVTLFVRKPDWSGTLWWTFGINRSNIITLMTLIFQIGSFCTPLWNAQREFVQVLRCAKKYAKSPI